MARILLVDDDAATRNFVKRALEMDRHAVVVASDGQDALDRLAADAGFDLIISDVQMAPVDGLQLAADAAQLRPGLPVLLMSGFAVDQGALKSRNLRVVGFVTKPFTLDTMRAAAAAALK